MDKNDFYNFSPYDNFTNFEQNGNDIYKEPIFNPIMQYEQGYMYYRFLCMQLEYKIKCKEYEKTCNPNSEKKIN